MPTQHPTAPQPEKNTPSPGLRYARWAGIVTGLILCVYGPLTIVATPGSPGFYAVFRGVFFALYGILLLAPLHHIRSDRTWTAAFILLVACSIAFVFMMIITVMFNYMAAAEQGERLGVPGREGTLIFLSLLQVPVQVFLRKPDLMD